MFGLGGADDDVGDVLDVDRATVARGQQQQADVRHALQRLARHDGQGAAVLAQRADDERPVGVGQLVDELVQRDAVEREALRIGLDPDLVRAAADDVGAADVVDLGELVLQLFADLVEAVVGPLAGVRGIGRKREVDDRDVVDAAADDHRLRDALGQVDDVGADLLVDAQNRGVLVGADEEARGDEDAVVLGLRVDVLDAVDALDDVFERARDQFDRVVGLVAVGRDHDVDHRHADLRLFLARQRDERDRAGGERRQQEKRRQRRLDEARGSALRKDRASWRDQHVAVREAGQDFDAVVARLAGLHHDFDAVRGLHVIDAGATKDIRAGMTMARRAPVLT